MRYLFILFFIIAAKFSSAQERGVLTVVKDPIIDSAIAKRLELGKKAAVASVPSGNSNTTIVSSMGYRVQVFYGSDRREIYSEQARFKGLFPKYNSYITYNAPNYYLRVGDFRSRMDAQLFLNEIRPLFPTLFIFREKIYAQDPEK